MALIIEGNTDFEETSCSYPKLNVDYPADSCRLNVEPENAECGRTLYLSSAGYDVVKIAADVGGGASPYVEMKYGRLTLGQSHWQNGILYLEGGLDTGNCAEIRIYNDADHDDTVDYYRFMAYDEKLIIKTDGGTPILQLDGTGDKMESGVGHEDSVAGLLHIYAGDDSGEGAEIRLYNDAENDGDVDYYQIRTVDTRLLFEADSYGEILRLDGVQGGVSVKKDIAAWETAGHAVMYMLTYSAAPALEGSHLFLCRSASDTVALVDTSDEDLIGQVGWCGVENGKWAYTAAIASFQVGSPDEGADNLPGCLELATFKGTGEGEHWANQVYLHPNGRVGFHQGSPQSWLHAHRAEESVIVDLRFTNTSSGDGDADGLTVGLSGNLNGFLYNYEYGGLCFGTNGAERMRIESGGNVGIGTDSPAGQLEVDQYDDAAAIPVLVLDQADSDQPFIEFQGGTVYTSKSGQDEYLKVKDPNGSIRYIRLYL